jgi:adenosylcobinamide kinase/adenosylcobinamide-phosphate guanylyltransferase
MGKITLISGGIRSGKSGFCTQLAKKKGGKVIFVTPCCPEDEEMRERIAEHKRSRPAGWVTVQEMENPEWVLKEYPDADVIIIDCLGMLVANWLTKGKDVDWIYKKVESLCHLAKEGGADWIIVTNEVGQSLVPENKMGRVFVDTLGRVNQIVAQHCSSAYILFFGKQIRVR